MALPPADEVREVRQALAAQLLPAWDAGGRRPRLSRRAWGRMITHHGATTAQFPEWVEVLLVVAVLLAVALEVLDSVEWIRRPFHEVIAVTNVLFIALFALEYCSRAWLTTDRWGYLCSFAGTVDLLSFLPGLMGHWIACVAPVAYATGMQMHFGLWARVARLFRVFRILKLLKYAETSKSIMRELNSQKSLVFIFGFSLVSLILSTVMYILEGGQGHFNSIPSCFYWVVVTMSTVGYGDVVPQTPLGQAFAIVVIILGYGAIVAQGIRTSSRPTGEAAASRSIGSFAPEPMAAETPWAAPPGGASRGLLEALKAGCRALSNEQRAELVAHLAHLISQECKCGGQC